MTITRRNLLKGMLAAATAPAFVKADSLMKIWVPDNKIALIDAGSWIGFDAGDNDVGTIHIRAWRDDGEIEWHELNQGVQLTSISHSVYPLETIITKEALDAWS